MRLCVKVVAICNLLCDKFERNGHLPQRANSSAGGACVGNGRLRWQFVRFARHRGGGTGDFGADFASEAWGAVGMVNGRLPSNEYSELGKGQISL